MPLIREFLRRIWYLLNRRRLEAELEQEMQSHREMLAESHGVNFGNSLQLREQSRDIWGWNWIDTSLQDLRSVRRTLRPGFAIAAALILSLGIGLNLTLFQLAQVTIFSPVPVKDPRTAVQFYRLTKNSRSNGVRWQEFDFIRRNNSVLSAVLIQTGGRDMFWGQTDSIPVRVNFVSPNWFEEFGFPAAQTGRVLHEQEDGKPDAEPALILSDRFWRSRLGADPTVVGRKVFLNNRPVTVAGVAPERMPDMSMGNLDVWIAYPHLDYFFPGTDHRSLTLEMFGRLQPGITPTAAREALRAPMAEAGRKRLAGIPDSPESKEGDAWLEPFTALDRFEPDNNNEEIWIALGLAASLALLVLLIACANVGNLILARAIGRTRELSVRAALGASRWRIMRLLLMECAVLAAAGAFGGILLAAWGTRTLVLVLDLPAYLDFTPGFPLIAASAGAALISILACGLLPALRISRQDLSAAMKDGGNQSSTGLERTRLRKLLVTAQVAGCTLLLIVAGLMVRSLQRLLHADRGFDFEQVATLDPSLSSYGMKSEASRVWWDEVLRTVRSHPEVESAALAVTAPLGDSLNESSYNAAPGLKILNFEVESGFLALMRIPVLAGRDLVAADDARHTVVVSRRVAQQMYGSLDVLGKTFPKSATGKDARTIVGVAGDAHMLKVAATDTGEIYLPIHASRYDEGKLIVRARTDAQRLLLPLRQIARTADDRILAQVSLMRSDFERKLRAPRLTSAVSLVMGLLALALACLGIYGVVQFSTAVRTKEIGIRIALGATHPAVLTLLLRQQGWPLFAGAGLGIAISIPAGMLLQGEPLYLNPAEPVVPAAATTVLALTAGVAAIVPALRALRLDPLKALRQD